MNGNRGKEKFRLLWNWNDQSEPNLSFELTTPYLIFQPYIRWLLFLFVLIVQFSLYDEECVLGTDNSLVAAKYRSHFNKTKRDRCKYAVAEIYIYCLFGARKKKYRMHFT